VGKLDIQADGAEILMVQAMGQNKRAPGRAPGAASKVEGHPLPRDKRGTRKRTGRDKYSKWPPPPPPQELEWPPHSTGQHRE